jgi:TolA-binding protein
MIENLSHPQTITRHNRFAQRLLFAGLFTLTLLLAPVCHAETADECFALASNHYQRGQWRQSIEYFRQLIDQHPQDPRVGSAIFYLGEALVQVKEYKQARVVFERFVRESPDHKFNQRGRFRIGETSYLAEQFEIAYQYLSEFYREYPQDDLMEYALPYLGQLEIDRGNTETGIAHFEEALQRFPNGILADECRFGLGLAFRDTAPAQSKRFIAHVAERGKPTLADDASFELGQILFLEGKYSQAAIRLAEFESRFRESEIASKGRYWYGRCLARDQQFELAQQVLKEVITTNTDKELAPAIHFEAAVVARHLESFDESNGLLKKLIESWPDCQWIDESLLLLTQNEYQTRNYFFASQHAQRFLAEFPQSEFRANVAELQGKSLLSLEQNLEAAAVFRNLIRTELEATQSRRASWHYLQGLALLRVEQSNEALAAFAEAARLTNDPSLQAAIYLAQATVHLKQNSYSSASSSLQAYLKVADRDANRTAVLAELARAFAMNGEFRAAGEQLELLRESQGETDEQHTLFSTASLLAEEAYRQEEFELAQKWFQLLIDSNLREFQARGLSGLAWSQAESDQAELAQATFKKLIEQYPKSELVDEAIMKLGLLEVAAQNPAAAMTTFARFEREHRASPYWPDAVLHLVQLSQQTGKQADLQLASQQIQTLLEIKTELKENDKFLYQLAWLQNDLGDREQSEKIFKQISFSHRHSRYWADASYRVAEIAVSENRLDEAKQILEQLIHADLDASDVAVHGLYLQGKIAVDQEDWTSVARLMGQLADFYPTHELCSVAKYWRAEAAYKQQAFEVAREQFTQLYTKIDEAKPELAAGIMLRSAQLQAKQQSWDRAKEIANDFVGRYPDHGTRYEADYIIGRSFSQEGKFTSARDAYDRVLQSRPARGTETAAMAQFMIGESYFHQEEFTQAIKAYHKTEILHPYPQWQSAALLQCGKAYEMQSEWQDAIACYRRLLKEFGGTTYAIDAASRLAGAQTRIKSDVP